MKIFELLGQETFGIYASHYIAIIYILKVVPTDNYWFVFLLVLPISFITSLILSRTPILRFLLVGKVDGVKKLFDEAVIYIRKNK